MLAPMLKRLKFLGKNVDLEDPEKVMEFMVSKNYADGYKDNLDRRLIASLVDFIEYTELAT